MIVWSSAKKHDRSMRHSWRRYKCAQRAQVVGAVGLIAISVTRQSLAAVLGGARVLLFRSVCTEVGSRGLCAS